MMRARRICRENKIGRMSCGPHRPFICFNKGDISNMKSHRKTEVSRSVSTVRQSARLNPQKPDLLGPPPAKSARKSKNICQCPYQLHRLPCEILEKILIISIVEELRDRVAKSVWEKGSEKIIKKLETVCCKMKFMLSLKSFRVGLLSAMNSSGVRPFTLEFISSKEHAFPFYDFNVTQLNDKLYVLRRDYGADSQQNSMELNVFTCRDGGLNERRFQLKGIKFDARHTTLVACHNCLYFQASYNWSEPKEVWKISPENVEPIQWLQLKDRIGELSVSNGGDLMFILCGDVTSINIYGSDASLLQCIPISRKIGLNMAFVMQRSNGNFIIKNNRFKISEINMKGEFLHENDKEQRHKIWQDVLLLGLNDFILAIRLGGIFVDIFDSELNWFASAAIPVDDIGSMVHYDPEKKILLVAHSNVWELSTFRIVL